MNQTRRDFLRYGSAALLGGSAFFSTSAFAAGKDSSTKYLDLPLGLQLYSVRTLLPQSYEGTLRQIAALGYRQVEAAGYYGHDATQVKQAMQQAGLHCVSAHYSQDALLADFDQIVAFNRRIGVESIICASPARPHPAASGSAPFTLADWRWNAEQLNKFGAKVHAAGMKFGYHNHTREFHPVDGVIPYDELMRRTDPATVTMEMDCGWVVVGGGDPVDLLHRYPTRISMLHVKDFKSKGTGDPESAPPPAAELGRGVIDYRPIFAAAAATGHVRHCFVEQEEFTLPPMESLRIDADYMRKLHA